MIDPILRTVGTMMQRFGGPATLEKQSGEATYDPATSSMTASSVATYTLQVIVFDYIQKHSGTADYAGTLIRTGDKQVYIKPDANVPAPAVDDIVTFEGARWRVIGVKAHNPSGANVYMYEVYMRQ